MPVDLTAIPDVASRAHPPSIKRWLFLLLIFMVFGSFLTSWLWPENLVTREALFWHCSISVPAIIWAALFGIRWIVWLTTVWPANGWDDEREQDIKNEIRRGQSFLVLGAASVRLPHIVTSGALTEQFLLPKGIELPSVVDVETHTISYIAQFSDNNLPSVKRIQNRLQELLSDPALKAALFRHKTTNSIQIILQIDPSVHLSTNEQEILKKQITKCVAVEDIHLSPHFGLSDIDGWLDKPKSIDLLLLLSVCIRATISDGEGEAAIALLLHTENAVETDRNSTARFHRPEYSKDTVTLLASAKQALVWGGTDTEHIESLWFAGMGTENKTPSFLSENHLHFPRAKASAQITDIDMKVGLTGVTSPWLAVALAAGQPGSLSFPQLVMSVSKDSRPWWVVVHPAGKIA
ncbi:hypothetical protein [Cedecea neteri]|uniref:hypothetical protein n=1 Tax=Cedecea neteri TaxID=158822 RepID=UPI0004F69545|nr:hypothetical protein [Cedecea neteri]AIR66366.1 hypothetical protein LH86_15080 [Cedecea neteri]